MRHARIEDDGRALAQAMTDPFGVDGQFTAEAVNDHVTGCLMFAQVPAGLEREQQNPQRPTMHETRLAVPVARRVWFRAKDACQFREVQRHHGTGQSFARVGPEPLVW